MSRTGLWLFVSLPTGCPPSALRQAAKLGPPPCPRPSSLCPIRHHRPSYLFLCKRLEAGACQTPSGKSACFPESGDPNAYIPEPLHTGRLNTVVTKVQTCSLRSAFVPLCADHTSVQLNLRVGELVIPSMKRSSPWMSFLLWEQCLTF